jgi:serine/threonine-protein kinase
MYGPYGLTAGSGPDAGTIFVAEYYGSRVVGVDPDGVMRLVAGTTSAGGFAGDDGIATSARFSSPHAVAYGPGRRLYVADYANHRIRVVDLGTGMINTFAGNGATTGSVAGVATSVPVPAPWSVAVAPDGSVWVGPYGGGAADAGIKRIDAAGMLTIAIPYDATACNAAPVVFRGCSSGGCPMVFAADGTLYFAAYACGTLLNSNNAYAILRRTPAGALQHVAGTYAGTTGEGAPATTTSFSSIDSIALDPMGRVVFADTGTYRIRRVGTDGRVERIAGTGTNGSTGDYGPALMAQVRDPGGLLYADGHLFFTELSSYTLRVLW